MSLLVHELSQIVDRVAVFAPGQTALYRLFENMHVDLTSSLGAGQKLDLKAVALPDGPLRAWTSFTLGRRSGLDVRLSMLGFDLEDELPEDLGADLCDSFLLYLPADNPLSDRLLTAKLSDDFRRRPVVVAGLADLPEDSPHRLRAMALTRFLETRFERVRHIPSPDLYFRQALEWVLSFSV